ncbi:MAG: hypothetical protein DYH12_10550 [Sorangiineae bacterium PRO1]|nr:hypothetical protein [Sorangiineae bacterium PRO1]
MRLVEQARRAPRFGMRAWPRRAILVHRRLAAVRREREVLREYAGEDEAELFAVAVETFFGSAAREPCRSGVSPRPSCAPNTVILMT